MKKFAIIFLSILLFSNISAYTFLNIYLDENGEALFLGETDETLSLPKNVELNEGIINGATQELTLKNGEIWEFSYSLKSSEIYVVLPEGAVIKELNEGEIGLEDNKLSIYNKEKIEVKYTINGKEDNSQNILLIILVGIIILIFAYYFIKLKNKKSKKISKNVKQKKENKIEIVKSLLNEREKLILSRLEKTGKIKNSQLRKICEIPKASFSRHIQELERKKLIKRSGEGKNKFIELLEK